MKRCIHDHDNPDNANFCRICGDQFDKSLDIRIVLQKKNNSVDTRPFNIKFPEFHLRPLSEFSDLTFVFNSPEYVEDPSKSSKKEYLWIVKEEKFGILFWHHEDHWYGDTNEYNRIIKCVYDKIIKHDNMFECHLGNNITYIDLKGNILK